MSFLIPSSLMIGLLCIFYINRSEHTGFWFGESETVTCCPSTDIVHVGVKYVNKFGSVAYNRGHYLFHGEGI